MPCVLLGLVVLAGCPQGEGQEAISTPGAAPAQVTPEQDLKQQLDSLAETGAMMPGMDTIGDNIAAIKGTDAEKGAALEKAFEEINGVMGNPGQVKAMLETL